MKKQNKFIWAVKELIKMYSDSSSFFSKKRIESGIAFVTGQVGMLYFLFYHIEKLTAPDVVLWAGVEFAIAGYIINQIQKEKKNETEN